MREIKVRNNNGRCLIRFTHSRKPHSLTLGSFTDKAAKAHAERVANQIYLDCLAGSFDPSLAKYRPREEGKEPGKVDLSELLRERLEAKYNDADSALLKLLSAYGKPIKDSKGAIAFIRWLETERKLQPKSVSRYLSTLKVLSKELFGEIKVKVPQKSLSKPFSKDEIQRILSHLKTDRYYSHYHDYVAFLFFTGCRTSEAIGIQWKHIDFSRDEIHVYDSLGRGKGNAAKRERRGTKTGKGRIIPLYGELRQILLERANKLAGVGIDSEALIFTSLEGKPIDDHSFSQRCWKKTLETLGIEHRNPYQTRHTFISHCIEAGMNPVAIASITGHDPKVLFDHYAGLINKVQLPDLYA